MNFAHANVDSLIQMTLFREPTESLYLTLIGILHGRTKLRVSVTCSMVVR